MRVGSLFSGYGGLDMAVGGELAWWSDIEPAACTVMEAHHPGVPNIGDVSVVDWSEVQPVDVLTGGYPCQPFSLAGARKGTDDERHLWPYVRDAIGTLRPKLTVLENVRGHLSLGFETVLADLAELGLSARWGVVRASDAGAPHSRARLFIVAYASERERDEIIWDRCGTPTGGTAGLQTSIGGSRRVVADTPSSERGEPESKYLVTGGWSAESRERISVYFGPYESAVGRWEEIMGRTAPTPIVNIKGRDKLSSRFVEWMMGLPDGWVTDHGLTLGQELKLLGNGVVPQQARLALELL